VGSPPRIERVELSSVGLAVQMAPMQHFFQS